jgi:hypothetical protein
MYVCMYSKSHRNQTDLQVLYLRLQINISWYCPTRTKRGRNRFKRIVLVNCLVGKNYFVNLKGHHQKRNKNPIAASAQQLNHFCLDKLALFRTLGKGLGCVLIKSTLGPGKTQKGWNLGRKGYTGAMGDKGDSLRATWD